MNDVDLRLLSVSGTTLSSSTSSTSIWEKTSHSVSQGQYKIRVSGFSVVGTQAVYIAGIIR